MKNESEITTVLQCDENVLTNKFYASSKYSFVENFNYNRYYKIISKKFVALN